MNKRGLGLVLLLALLGALLPLTASGTSEDKVCPQVDGWSAHQSGDLTVAWGTATVSSGDPGFVTFAVADGWTVEVCVKGGPEFTLTTIVGPSTQDVYTPEHPNPGKHPGVSHWGYRAETTPTTPTTEDTTTTTKPEDTTTTDPGDTTTTSTTTTAPPSTTTEPPTTTTTEPPSTTTTTSPPATSTTTTMAPPTTTTPTTSPPELPPTGLTDGPLAGVALVALALGTGLLAITRKEFPTGE